MDPRGNGDYARVRLGPIQRPRGRPPRGAWLSRELKTLAAFGLITRRDFHVVPPKVEYALTPVGKELLPLVSQVIKFGKRHLVRRAAAT